MEHELQHYLYHMNAQDLAGLMQTLLYRHPTLRSEIESMIAEILAEDQHNDAAPFDPASLILNRIDPQPLQHTKDLALYKEQLELFLLRPQRGDTPQHIFDDLVSLLQEAEQYADQYDYQHALAIYAMTLDIRLLIQHPTLSSIFDRAIDEFMPVIDMILSEVSNEPVSENSNVPSSSIEDDDDDHMILLEMEQRQQWLHRLFHLWLQRLNNHQPDENLSSIIFDVAWPEDRPYLYQLIQQEMAPLHAADSKVVDFIQRSRVRVLANLLNEIHLPS